ncbi:MAG: phosphoadenosine phosphosulfate reductase family protein [Thermoactinomyces sp.]
MIVRKEGRMNVVEAARKRIENIFSNGVPVYLSFSGGKDSLCLGHLVLSLIQEGRIDPSLLTVQFIDEEAIFPCIEKTVKTWRKKFLLAGAKFQWYCLEVKHFNCLNELENDESFICWDKTKRDVWVRNMPEFAITHHPLLNPRKMTYQAFLKQACMDGILITGVRAYESIQRMQFLAQQKYQHRLSPIYDWKDSDVWLYLFEHQVEIPNVYLYLWQTGLSRKELRVSQFFSIDTVKNLVNMNEYYPDLMERITLQRT